MLFEMLSPSSTFLTILVDIAITKPWHSYQKKPTLKNSKQNKNNRETKTKRNPMFKNKPHDPHPIFIEYIC